MDREVFPSFELRSVAEDFVPIRLNIDLVENGDICRTWQRAASVPSFVVLGPYGSIVDRWEGALDAETFATRLLRGRTRALSKPIVMVQRDRFEQAMRRLSSGDMEPLRELIAALDHRGQDELAKRLSLMEVRDHFFHYRWSLAVEAAELMLRRWSYDQEAGQLRARALFRGTGEIEPETRERVAELIEIFGRSKPILGGDEAARFRHKQRRATHGELVSIGEPAVDQLMEALLTASEDTSERCAICIGHIRDSRVLPDLITHLKNKKLRNPVRARVAGAMDVWCDPAFLPALLGRLADKREALDVRTACADAVRRLGISHGGLRGSEVIEPVFEALSERNKHLRIFCLRVLPYARDDFDLARLFPYMEDDRSDGEHVVSDLACELFLRRAGQSVTLADGTAPASYPAGTAEFLENWWNLNAGTLVWDDQRTRYYVKRSD
jgi:hypothetical protein